MNENMDCRVMKNLIRFKLVNYDANKEELAERPYIRYLDLAIVFYIVIDSNPDGVMTTKIFNYNLADWKITEEELFKIARQNMERQFPVYIEECSFGRYSGAWRRNR